MVSVPHSSDLRFYFPQLKQNIAKSIINPSTTSSIGHLLWGGKDAPEDLIYVEGYSDPASKFARKTCTFMAVLFCTFPLTVHFSIFRHSMYAAVGPSPKNKGY